MKCHCHCGLEKHLRRLHVRKFGVLGIVLMGLHILLHVVECLVLPAIIVAFSSHSVEETAVATDTVWTRELTNDTMEYTEGDPEIVLLNFWQSLELRP